MKEYVPPLEIAAESCMNNSGETVLTLYGDHGVPDIIVCDRKRYIQEPTVDRDALLKLADEMEDRAESYMAQCPGTMKTWVATGDMHVVADKIRKACGE